MPDVLTNHNETVALAKRLRKASRAYYNGANSVMSDDEFDRLRQELKDLSPDHPFLKQIGAPIAEHLEKVSHNIPMGSLNNAANEAEYRTWHSKHNEQVVVMHKLDGSSIEIVYKDGVLVQASSRGDGQTGEVVLVAGVADGSGRRNGELEQ